ncbi:hypothetical protein [Bradyrhizobium sp. WSM3983]|uniref:hypothetical protein n=1 Tax=Bradyrhizobium sp. WSM3983 TaxID=1038867 RepID=UPI00040A1C29|nr:hypothetical protein [Bradyrhizobium sp. WSM3983]
MINSTDANGKRTYFERIGSQDWELTEELLNVHDEVSLWPDNPRLQTWLPVAGVRSEPDLEAALEETNGYDTLKKSILDLGQMEPIYVWRPNPQSKFLVLEGATRVSILRQLDRKYTTGLKEGTFRRVKAKVLPPNFGEKERAILLARIHVRGSGVREWGRYIEAKFIYETVVGKNGQAPLMNQAQMAQYMEKSESWVNRLKNAYEFSLQFIEHIDDENGPKIAAKSFSILEELSKAKVIGSQLREYDNAQHDTLRHDVFEMVRNDVFKEYREARFLKEFYDDHDKWEQLKGGERHIASRLATEVKSNASSPKAKISTIPQMIKRSIERGETEFGEDDVEALQQALDQITDQIHPGVRPFRVALKKMTRTLTEASLADVKALPADEVSEFREALDYFNDLIGKHSKAA